MPVLRAPATRDRYYWFCPKCGLGSGSSTIKEEAEKDFEGHACKVRK